MRLCGAGCGAVLGVVMVRPGVALGMIQYVNKTNKFEKMYHHRFLGRSFKKKNGSKRTSNQSSDVI